MKSAAWRLRAAVLLCAACAFGLPQVASAGEIAGQAAEAERLLRSGEPAEALAAFDRSAAAFWDDSPLQLRVVLFADRVGGYADYTPRADAAFRNGDTLLIYLEPFGFAFMPAGSGFRSVIAADVRIQTPGGLILGSAEDFVRLEWQGRSRMREVHATIALPLPELKAGDYELLLTLRDQGSAKETAVTLPLSVAEAAPDAP